MSHPVDEILISSDSHVMEDPDLWVNGVPAALKEEAPKFPPRVLGEGFQAQPGGWDPAERIKEMAKDGVSAEVLYPTLGLGGVNNQRNQRYEQTRLSMEK